MIKNKLLLLLVLLMTAATGAWAQGSGTTYSVKMKDGTQDAKNWTIASGDNSVKGDNADGLTGLKENDAVTVSYSGRMKVKSVTATTDAGPDPLAVPLTIEAITPGNISVSGLREGFQYSKNGGAKTAVTNDEIVLNAGDKVQFYGNGTSITYYQGTTINGIGDGFTCKVYGNIMSLVDEEGFATATKLSQGYTFAGLFFGFNTLTDASGLLLPATELAEFCYYEMFNGCTALTTAPALPATQLAAYCYRLMFSNCSTLTAAPALPAETLAENCYYQMFRDCQKLATVTCLATSGIGVSNSTYNWLYGAGSQVQGTKTFKAVSAAEWPSGNSGIPDGWTRANVTQN